MHSILLFLAPLPSAHLFGPFSKFDFVRFKGDPRNCDDSSKLQVDGAGDVNSWVMD